jgi:DNA repair protein RecN (Recombination protein N)
LSREVFAEGRSNCRINGRPATAATVRELCQNLVNIHGQLDNQELLDPDRHVSILDKFGGLEEEASIYLSAFNELLDLQKRINRLSMDETEKANRIDYLKYQIDEIEKAGLKIGDEEELQKRRVLMKNSEKITSSLLEVINSTDEENTFGGPSPMNSILNAVNELGRLEGLSASIDGLHKRLA